MKATLYGYSPVIGLQLLSVLLAAIVAAWLSGASSAISATLGGGAGIIGDIAFLLVAHKKKHTSTAFEALAVALIAEVIKLVVMFALLGLVVVAYRDVEMVGLISTFILSVVVFSLALFFIKQPHEQGT
ncbi:MAG: ATP synthase subunit I [Magnetococcales bacterium]|nr:ATP synthase subunit I [Magnetococcales bacterium]